MRARMTPRCAGLIPAWAGKTGALANIAYFGTAHPRVGGENAQGGEHVHGEAGSSPRGRGKPIG